MSAPQHGIDLLPVITLLAAGVVAGTLFKRLGLGSVLGYVAGGMAIPSAWGSSRSLRPSCSGRAGIVMFLFIVGLEMRPSRLWGMRQQIFGLGSVQVGLGALLLMGVGFAAGFPVVPSFVAAAGFVLLISWPWLITRPYVPWPW